MNILFVILIMLVGFIIFELVFRRDVVGTEAGIACVAIMLIIIILIIMFFGWAFSSCSTPSTPKRVQDMTNKEYQNHLKSTNEYYKNESDKQKAFPNK